MLWQKKKNRYNTKPYYEANEDGVVYQIRYIPFKGWQASKQEGYTCTLPGIKKDMAEAMNWCVNNLPVR
jgi:hypothetical protein